MSREIATPLREWIETQGASAVVFAVLAAVEHWCGAMTPVTVDDEPVEEAVCTGCGTQLAVFHPESPTPELVPLYRRICRVV